MAPGKEASLYKQAFTDAITKQNIYSSFRATGLVLFCPDVILSQLDIQL